MPERCVTEFLACNEQHRCELISLLMEYKDVFLTELPKRVLPNRYLGDEMKTKLVPGTEPIWQKMYTAGGFWTVILSWAMWKRSWAGCDPT